MASTFSNWKTDNYKFVGKAFDFAYADRLNRLSPVVGEGNARSIDHTAPDFQFLLRQGPFRTPGHRCGQGRQCGAACTKQRHQHPFPRE